MGKRDGENIPEAQRRHKVCQTVHADGKRCHSRVFQLIDAVELVYDALDKTRLELLGPAQGLICVECRKMLDPNYEVTDSQEIFPPKAGENGKAG